jgi:hypothetical protein
MVSKITHPLNPLSYNKRGGRKYKIVLERDSGSCEKLRTRKFLAENFRIE